MDWLAILGAIGAAAVSAVGSYPVGFVQGRAAGKQAAAEVASHVWMTLNWLASAHQRSPMFKPVYEGNVRALHRDVDEWHRRLMGTGRRYKRPRLQLIGAIRVAVPMPEQGPQLRWIPPARLAALVEAMHKLHPEFAWDQGKLLPEVAAVYAAIEAEDGSLVPSPNERQLGENIESGSEVAESTMTRPDHVDSGHTDERTQALQGSASGSDPTTG